MCLTVLLADDSDLVRRGIKSHLKDCCDIAVVGETSNLTETIRQARMLLPDAIILDIRMTEGNTPDWDTSKRPAIVAISFAGDREAKKRAGELGAENFIDKMDLAEQLIPTLRAIASRKSTTAI
jgi:DNA-binding NarL/FixJ family response regulator